MAERNTVLHTIPADKDESHSPLRFIGLQAAQPTYDLGGADERSVAEVMVALLPHMLPRTNSSNEHLVGNERQADVCWDSFQAFNQQLCHCQEIATMTEPKLPALSSAGEARNLLEAVSDARDRYWKWTRDHLFYEGRFPDWEGMCQHTHPSSICSPLTSQLRLLPSGSMPADF